MNTQSSTARSAASCTNRSRCQHRTATGRQCRNIPASGSRSAFCRRHSQLTRHRDHDFSAQLLCRSGSLRTPADINAALAATFTLLAEGRISPRRASSLAYITSLIMNNDFAAQTRDDYTFQDVFAAIRADNQRRAQESASPAAASRSAYASAPGSAYPASPSTQARPATPSATAASIPVPASAPTSAPASARSYPPIFPTLPRRRTPRRPPPRAHPRPRRPHPHRRHHTHPRRHPSCTSRPRPHPPHMSRTPP